MDPPQSNNSHNFSFSFFLDIFKISLYVTVGKKRDYFLIGITRFKLAFIFEF